MATTVANRKWRPSAAESIDADLTALWREIAREAPVSRAVLSNLVVFCRSTAGENMDLASPPEGVPIDEVARNHPARVILLYHDPAAPGKTPSQASLVAQVGVLTFGPPDARYGVEQIVIRSACSKAALPSIVRRLMLGDLPTSVWWTDDLSETGPLAPLVTMGRQLLFNSRRWRDVRAAVLALAPLLSDPFGPDLADVNWRRLLPVRQALVHALGSSDVSKRQRLTSVHIRHRRGEAALAWLLAGWLHDAEGFGLHQGRSVTPGPEGPGLHRPEVTPGPEGPGLHRPEVTPGPEGPGLHRPEVGRVLLDPPIRVDEDANLDDDVLTAVFDDGLHLRLGSHRVSVDDPLGPAPFGITAPSETEAEAVAAELRVLTHDVSLHNALTALVELFGGA